MWSIILEKLSCDNNNDNINTNNNNITSSESNEVEINYTSFWDPYFSKKRRIAFKISLFFIYNILLFIY